MGEKKLISHLDTHLHLQHSSQLCISCECIVLPQSSANLTLAMNAREQQLPITPYFNLLLQTVVSNYIMVCFHFNHPLGEHVCTILVNANRLTLCRP